MEMSNLIRLNQMKSNFEVMARILARELTDVEKYIMQMGYDCALLDTDKKVAS